MRSSCLEQSLLLQPLERRWARCSRTAGCAGCYCWWRWLVVAHLPGLLMQAALPSLLPESPRFLLVAGEVERARTTVQQVFKGNGCAAPEPLCLQQPAATAGDRSTMGQLWRRELRLSTSVIGFTQGVCTMTFYAITFDKGLNTIGGSLYRGALLGALVELPAYVLLAPLANGLGRRGAYASFFLISASALVIVHVCLAGDDAEHWGALTAVLSGRFASVAAVNVAYIVSAEIFPTLCRNSGIGWGTGCGRMGAILAPMVMTSAPSPLLLFAALCVIAAASVWALPESTGRAMTDMPEAERICPPQP